MDAEEAAEEAARKFAKRVTDALLAHKGQRVNLEEIVGSGPETIHDVVLKLGRLGWVIEAEKGVPGYTFVEFTLPERWLRLAPTKRKTQGGGKS